MEFRFSRNRRFTTCALRWDWVSVDSVCVCVCVCVCVLYGTITVRCRHVHSIQHATSLFLHVSLPLWWFLIKQQRWFTEQRNRLDGGGGTTFVIDFDFCPGGRAQHRILACMWQNHLNQVLQTEPFLSVVMNEITCMLTVLFRSIF